jgi:CRISPR-associated protein Cas5
MNINLNFLLEPPDFSVRGKLTIEALAPLSMVSSMPGKYYRCQPEPTDEMLFGMIENAFGFHLTSKADKERGNLIKKLSQKHKVEIQTSDVGFSSFLQFHIRVSTRFVPDSIHYDDYWSQHQRGASFVGGSREYDYRAIPIMNLHSQKAIPPNATKEKKKIEFSDKADAIKDLEKINSFEEWENIHLNVVRPYFPQYYISPTPRGYVIPQGSYKYVLETSARISKLLVETLENPISPIYLGSNDGWIDVSYEELR